MTCLRSLSGRTRMEAQVVGGAARLRRNVVVAAGGYSSSSNTWECPWNVNPWVLLQIFGLRNSGNEVQWGESCRSLQENLMPLRASSRYAVIPSVAVMFLQLKRSCGLPGELFGMQILIQQPSLRFCMSNQLLVMLILLVCGLHFA